MKLRCMTGIYLRQDGRILLLYRQHGSVVSDTWVASAGGHFEENELNDPRACVLRELNEELGLTEDDLLSLKMRYIGLRRVRDEIRENYYFFADLKPERTRQIASNEGRCEWIQDEDVMKYDMPLTARHVMAHYLEAGRYTDELYCAVSDGEGFRFIPLREH